MPEVPVPSYDYDAEKLVKAYQEAFERVLARLETMEFDDMTRAHQLATLKSIGEIIAKLDKEAAVLVEASLNKAASDGIIRAIVSLGVVNTVEEAQAIVRFSKINKELVNAAISDTQDDLLAVTKNIDRRIRTAVRQVSAEVMRNKLTQGINGTQSLKRDVYAGLRKKLGSALDTGIIDAGGNRWRPHTYVDMLVRTKMMEAHKESTINEALGRDVLYGIISKHGAKDACSKWEGKIVKLTSDAPGDYPYVGDLPKREIFHIRCKHVVSPIRKPERYA